MKRLVLGGAIVALLAGGASVSVADPGPFGPNNWGLCNAYAHNNSHAHQAPPFEALEAAAEAEDQTVEEWCAANGQKPGGGNGNGGGRG